jgi:hypothetical protein
MKKAFIVFLAVFGIVFLHSAAFAQDLIIDYRFNTARADTNNYLTFTSAMRYIAVNNDTYDAVTGASKQKATSLIAPLQYDIMGRNTISAGFRGLLLFAVSPEATRIDDNFRATREGNVITIEYAHRGVAYRIQTDQQGNITFPRGSYVRRTIGYIRGPGPQVISRDFSANQTAASIDWRRVWDPQIPSGTISQRAKMT